MPYKLIFTLTSLFPIKSLIQLFMNYLLVVHQLQFISNLLTILCVCVYNVIKSIVYGGNIFKETTK